MDNFSRITAKRILLISLFVLMVFTGWTQVFQNGIRRGMIKVKISPTISTSLSKAQVKGSTKTLKTGISSFDAVAKSTSATNLYRLFPGNSNNESKLIKHGLDLWYVIEINENVDPKTAVALFKKLNEVTTAEVELEKVLSPFNATSYVPTSDEKNNLPFNDPYLKDQWHYNNTGQSGYGDADINLFEAWTKTAGANNVIVSIHDQGVDVTHKDLKENIWVNTAELNGVAGVDDDNNGYIDDINGYNFQKNKGAVDPEFHGTHVAGTIAAVNNNGIGVSGVAGGSGKGDGVKIMSLQIFGGLFENSYIYAADNGSVISQNSWGYTNPYSYDQSVKEAIDYFIAEAGNYPGSPMKGGIVIFAAGNSNNDGEWYPGYFSNVLAVAAIGPEWKKASYSNFGDWVELSATGGDQDTYGSKSGVLSTTPKDQYAYLQGTSMACPHVSGIAALALANSTKQLTNTELWNKLVTGVVDIEQYNPDYLGKLGSGTIDASLAIANDQGVAPVTISNLAVTGIAQEFATLSWTVPSDIDDIKPTAFQLYYFTEPITASNLSLATKVVIKNEKDAGQSYSYEVNGLLGLTTYYFAITSTDRWGNISVLSNVVSETTNQGPSIAVDDNSQSINLEIDAVSTTSASHEITILNNAAGLLRWNHFMRHSNTSLAFNAIGLKYPKVRKQIGINDVHVRLQNASVNNNQLRSKTSTSSFTQIEKTYISYVTNIVGDTDTSLTNSSATKFYVNEANGFNLTQVQTYIKHDPAKGPVILEIYKGSTLAKDNLIYAQEYSNYSTDEAAAYITLNEQLYFEKGDTFWVVVHVPSGNLYPLGIGPEADAAYSKNCFISFNLGQNWVSLEEALNDKRFVWAVTAVSQNEHLGSYLTLEPGSGDVDGNSQTTTLLSANAAMLINGSYSAYLVLASNDVNKKELRVPVNLTVLGHQPNIKLVDIAEFGNTFLGSTKTLELVVENQGFGNFNDVVYSVSGSEFTIDGWVPSEIIARNEVVLKMKFTPTHTGNINDVLTITNGTLTYQISLFGVGAETSKIEITPLTQTVDNITIGDEISANITVSNTGAYPLKYFIPGFDSRGVSNNWPTNYHKYGYKQRSNRVAESNPIAYEFNDIKTTGVEITDQINTSFKYATINLSFDFPYYGQNMHTLYVAKGGFTTFDNTVNPINTPRINDSWGPKGYISPLGGYFSFVSQGQVFYQIEADRVVIQYDMVCDGYNLNDYFTVQQVLFANGDIRFYYDHVGTTDYLNILIDNLDQNDGILVQDYTRLIEMYDGLALGFDYPGPSIIKSITNGSGILSPGNSATVNVTMATSTLPEGAINRYINFINNDPSNSQISALVKLNITDGGVAKPLVSSDTIKFGDVLQGAVKKSIFSIKNAGTANVNITGITLINGSFNLTGKLATSIKPSLFENYNVEVPSNALATLEDWASINYADGSQDTIYLSAKVVDAPGININLDLLQQTLAYGDSISLPFTIENTGLGKLEVTTKGKEWLSFDAPTSTPDDITYTYEKLNQGEVYQWVDIRKTGTQLPFYDFNNYDETFWRTLTLPFPIEFYGEKYTSFKIGDNGLISFEENPQASFYTDFIPSEIHSGPCIMPYWTFSGFSDYMYAKADIGIFYKFYNDKIIVTWSYFVNNFGGMGDPVSAQVIFYKNGTMKFQYKAEEGGVDATSRFSTIGIQKNSKNGIMISEYQELDYGKGLAYVLVPAKKLIIEPNSTLTGQLNLDARNVFGGVYNQALKLQTNVPGKENLEKPVELTVTGDAVFTAESMVDFGIKMVTYEYGMPKSNYMDLTFKNEGAAPYDITWAQMVDGTMGLSLEIYALVDGWFGPEWRWADISELYSLWAFQTPTFSIKPGDELKVRAAFSPGAAGDFTDDLVLTTSMGEKRMTLKGSAIEPPVINVVKTPIIVSMNSFSETADKTINFGNVEGKSDLDYSISIEYRRIETTSISSSKNSSPASKLSLKSTIATTKNSAKAKTSYNRIITHTDKTTPNTFIGNGGSASVTIATKYNAGLQAFNLSHIEAFMRTEGLTSGIIEVEILAGGSSIANAQKVAQGKLEFIGSGNDESGAWYQVKMDKSAKIYPNEDFYVSVTFPFGIAYPIGSITNSETVEGRYFYYDQGTWGDIQQISGFENIGWLMLAAEETADNTTWLTITSALDGKIAMGDASAVNLHFDGAYAQRGDQVANIVFSSNDPNSPIVKVPVKLHVNEGPKFEGITDNISVAENATLTLTYKVVDLEGNTFTIAPESSYSNMTYNFTNGKLTVTLKPQFGDAGLYTYVFKGTDEFNAISELKLNVDVIPTNRAPIFIGNSKEIVYHTTGNLIEYALNNFFSDPDNDAITFSVVNGNSNVADVFASANLFIVKPKSLGSTTLSFTIKDIHGAVLNDTINVVVDGTSGISDEENDIINAFPNPTNGFFNVTIPQGADNNTSIRITNIYGTVLYEVKTGNTSVPNKLDISNYPNGIYFVKVTGSGFEKTIKVVKN
jgi:subtilisin family serine protease